VRTGGEFLKRHHEYLDQDRPIVNVNLVKYRAVIASLVLPLLRFKGVKEPHASFVLAWTARRRGGKRAWNRTAVLQRVRAQ